MNQYVCVAEDEMEELIEVPLEMNGNLLLSTLSAQFPGACGLKYRNPGTGAMRGVRLVDGDLYPPDGVWSSSRYIVVYPKENADYKRKSDESSEKPQAKTKKVDRLKCSDLIVLGLPWKSTEEDLTNYFTKYGELLMVQVKKDPKSGQSKGFGFIRFADYESQRQCLSQRHLIDGRWCDVKIPSSKMDDSDSPISRKLFVGRCTEDMSTDDIREFFSSYGEVVDVFIPKPFRAFAFVTFSDPDVAQNLCGEDFIIKGNSVRCSSAAPKGYGYDKKGSWVSKLGGGDHRNSGWSYSGSTDKSMQGANLVPHAAADLAAMQFGPAFNQAVIAATQAALAQSGWMSMGGASNGQGGYHQTRESNGMSYAASKNTNSYTTGSGGYAANSYSM
ncbi:hypothetical protein HELRODRAFT_170286 [Helobdella robusta]|uniref:TAR DNA-binding protein 43 n=1 Tax=Helobdella robusta TaxID=6412 RepID=T1F2V8_HELRO|nr:hypothetical protein HELRODRAFT_170286 [Helobdella robusta]ESO07740.1 hypothetical protein HELRODRAFT_170286 [Helobdella robusta]